MNTIEISVLSPRAALSAFADTWHEGEASREPVSKLAFGSLRELFELGLLDRADDGVLSAPDDEILIHAGIRDAA